MAEQETPLFDIYGRPLAAGDQVIVQVGHGRGPGETQTRVAVVEKHTGYRLRYTQPTDMGVSSSNLAYDDELSDLHRRKAVKVVGPNDAAEGAA